MKGHKKSSTAQRLQQLMDERNLKQVDILHLSEPFCKKYGIKLGKPALSQYISGYFSPRQDKLSILSMALNVSEAWLMGYDVPMERQPENRSVCDVCDDPSSLSAADTELLRKFRQLNEEGQEKTLDYLDDLISSNKYIKDNSLGPDHQEA